MIKLEKEDDGVPSTAIREISLLKNLKHPNVVELKEVLFSQDKLYLVFEFVEKSMLDILEANPNGVDTETVRLLTCQLARAIEYCHPM